MMLVRQNSCCERPADGASETPKSVPQGRRAVLKAALGLGLCFSFFDGAFGRGEDPKTARPQEGDQFVFSSGDRDGQLVTAEYLPLGGPQQLAYPMDPRAKIVRNGSTLNLVALVRFDPAELADETRALAATGRGRPENFSSKHGHLATSRPLEPIPDAGRLSRPGEPRLDRQESR